MLDRARVERYSSGTLTRFHEADRPLGESHLTQTGLKLRVTIDAWSVTLFV